MLTSTQCTSGFDPTPDSDPTAPPIKEVIINPGIVNVGDTIEFKVILEDTLARNIKYRWNLFLGGGGFNQGYITVVPHLAWIAEISPGDYTGRVSVTDSTTAGPIRQEDFSFTVIE